MSLNVFTILIIYPINAIKIISTNGTKTRGACFFYEIQSDK